MSTSTSTSAARAPWTHWVISAAVLVVAALLAIGARSISGEAGYAGVGPNFLPWVMSACLAVCGLWLLKLSATGGWPDVPEASGAAQGDWAALAWVAAGVLANAALITRLGFVLSCALCFVLAVHGLRLAEGKTGGGLARWAADFGIGLAISLPVYWLFARGLSINLPALTNTGWL